jgi:hypothetical protein
MVIIIIIIINFDFIEYIISVILNQEKKIILKINSSQILGVLKNNRTDNILFSFEIQIQNMLDKFNAHMIIISNFIIEKLINLSCILIYRINNFLIRISVLISLHSILAIARALHFLKKSSSFY